MSNSETPDPFGPEDYEAVKVGIMRAFDEAVAAGAAQEPDRTATPAESARLLDQAFERWERAHGLNVLQFPERNRAGQRDGQRGD